jgi:hypothetical protein
MVDHGMCTKTWSIWLPDPVFKGKKKILIDFVHSKDEGNYMTHKKHWIEGSGKKNGEKKETIIDWESVSF